MAEYNNQLIAPPVEEEVYPYHHVWWGLNIQSIAIVLVTLASLIAQEFFNIQIDGIWNTYVSAGLIFLPVVTWLIFFVIPERQVLEPRKDLLKVALISGLTASAIGIPMVETIFRIDEWLPLESAIQRIIGYMLTVGIIDIGIKFIVIRYMAFSQHFRIRSDSVAYCIASAIGYGFVLSLYTFNNDNSMQFSIVILQVFSIYVTQIVSSLVLSYGFSETKFTNALPILLPTIILISALLNGVILSLSTGLRNGTITINGMTDRPLFTFGFLTITLSIIISVIYFLYTVSNRREREAYRSSDI